MLLSDEFMPHGKQSPEHFPLLVKMDLNIEVVRRAKIIDRQQQNYSKTN